MTTEQTIAALMAKATEYAVARVGVEKHRSNSNMLFCDEAFASLESALREAIAPPGFVMVPLEPTVAMTRAAARWLTNIHLMRAGDRTNAVNDAYRAMLSARPATAANMTDIPPSMTLADRCKTALECMPDSGFRAQTERLFADLLAAIPVADGEVKEPT